MENSPSFAINYKDQLLNIINCWGDYLLSNNHKFSRLDVGQGKSGTALFFLHKYLTFRQPADLATFNSLLEKIILGIGDLSANFLVVQLTEIGTFLSLYNDIIQEEFNIEDIADQIDEILSDYNLELLKKRNLDGYVGAGYPSFYFLQKKTFSPGAMDYLEALENLKQTDIRGNFSLSLDNSQEVQLGITHGAAFIAMFLAECISKGCNPKLSEKLLRGYTGFLIAQKQSYQTHGSIYPASAGSPAYCRSNLSYGDAGIFYGLLKSAMVLGDKKLMHETMLDLRAFILNTEHIMSTLKTNSILYGKSGMFLLFQHLAQMQQNDLLIATANRWRRASLEDLLQKMALLTESPPALNDISFAGGVTGELVIQMASIANDWRFKQIFFLC